MDDMEIRVYLEEADVKKDFFDCKENNLKCPFCQQKLVRHWGMKEPDLYCCDNPKCSRGGVGTEQSWQALIDTKKKLDDLSDKIGKLKSKLDIAVDGLETISLKEHKTTPSVFLIKYAQKTLEQIKDNDKDVK